MELFRYQTNLFYGIAGFIVLIIIYIQLLIRRERITTSIFDENILSQILPENLKNLRRTRDILIFTALFFMIIASSGPQWGIEYQEKPHYSANIAIVVDTSLSMSAKDIKPSRLQSVQLSLKSLIDGLQGYRISLLAFEDKAYIQCPLTDDLDAISYFIDNLSPNMLPYPGTNIADAIETSIEYLSPYPGEKDIILFTDGEDHSGKIDDIISNAVKEKARIITVGVGTTQGDLIYDEETKEYKKDSSGKTVISKLDEETLIKIAQKTEGKYIKYTTPEFVSSEIVKFLAKAKMSTEKERAENYKNRYQYILIISFLLILIEFIIMEDYYYKP